MLTERTKHMQLDTAGRTNCGGSARLFETKDGRVALNLARFSDWELLPALLETDLAIPSAESIESTPLKYHPFKEMLEALLAQHTSESLCQRAAFLGLPLSDACAEPLARASSIAPWTLHSIAPERRHKGAAPKVLDLAALWAGPLAGKLLADCGAHVTKVESTSRPDGARFGPAPFFEHLNGQKTCVTLGFADQNGIETLRQMILDADIVIESARPRGLRQLGLYAEELIAQAPGLTWLAISAYGRRPENELRVGFGDDAAVAAGLSKKQYESTGQWQFVGDAVADPMTGILGALGAYQVWMQGGGQLIDISLAGTIRFCIDHFDAYSQENLPDRLPEMVKNLSRAAPRFGINSVNQTPL
jgi:crotonobetainyl-CoA:carnitine CoA-transferase CaiB-like acyl-CoA transferase